MKHDEDKSTLGRKILQSNLESSNDKTPGLDLVLIIMIGIALGWMLWKN